VIPLKAEYPVPGFTPCTWFIVASCALIWLYEAFLPPESLEALITFYGATPALILSGAHGFNLQTLAIYSTLLTSLFLHANFLHVALNMLFFQVFSRNVEALMGPLRFAVFYLVCGVAGTLTHAALNADSGEPLIGASGAVAGVLAAHAMLLPFDRVRTLVFYGVVTVVNIQAWIFTAIWLGLQFLIPITGDPSIAWLAHLGGVVAGVALTPVFKRPGVPLFDEPRPRGPWSQPAA